MVMVVSVARRGGVLSEEGMTNGNGCQCSQERWCAVGGRHD